MSSLKVINQTSFSKIGAGLGIFLSGSKLGNYPIINVLIGITGSVIGSRFLLTTTASTTKDLKSQVELIKNHFDNTNPIKTNYDLYNIDPVYEQPLFGWIKNTFFSSEKEEYENKFISAKYFVHDYLRSYINPFYLGLDAAPAAGGMFKFLADEKSSSNFAYTCFEVVAIYAIRPYLNYALYNKGWLNDTEALELECSQQELKSFEASLPKELYEEMVRVAV